MTPIEASSFLWAYLFLLQAWFKHWMIGINSEKSVTVTVILRRGFWPPVILSNYHSFHLLIYFNTLDYILISISRSDQKIQTLNPTSGNNLNFHFYTLDPRAVLDLRDRTSGLHQTFQLPSPPGFSIQNLKITLALTFIWN